MSLSQKIRQIREVEGMTREQFAVHLDIPYGTLLRIEQGRGEPRASIITNICHAYPKYAFWLTTDQTQPEHGHISPEIEKTRKDSPGAAEAS